MYRQIQHPRTGLWHQIASNKGRHILKKYIDRCQVGAAAKSTLTDVVFTGVIQRNTDKGSYLTPPMTDVDILRDDPIELMGTYKPVEHLLFHDRGVWKLDHHDDRYLFYKILPSKQGTWVISNEQYMSHIRDVSNYIYAVTSDAMTPDKITEEWRINEHHVSGDVMQYSAPLVSMMLESKYSSIVDQSVTVGDLEITQLITTTGKPLYTRRSYTLMNGKLVNGHAIWYRKSDRDTFYLYYATSNLRGKSWWICSTIYKDGRGHLHVTCDVQTPNLIMKPCQWKTHFDTWQSVRSLDIYRKIEYDDILHKANTVGDLVIRGLVTGNTSPKCMKIYNPVPDEVYCRHGVWKNSKDSSYLYYLDSHGDEGGALGGWGFGTRTDMREQIFSHECLATGIENTPDGVEKSNTPDGANWKLHVKDIHQFSVSRASDSDKVKYTQWLEDVQNGNEELLTLVSQTDRTNPTDIERVTKLVNSGVDIETTNLDRHTALTIASRHGHTSMVDILIRLGADLKSDMPLRFAVTYGHVETVEYLLGYATHLPNDIVIVIARSRVPEETRSKMLKCLLNGNADINGLDSMGRTALWWAVELKDYQFVEELLRLHAGVDHPLNYGSIDPVPWGKAIHRAAFKGDFRMIQLLVDYNADVNSTIKSINRSDDRREYTPIHYAIRGSCYHINTNRGTYDYINTIAKLVSVGAIVKEDDPEYAEKISSSDACLQTIPVISVERLQTILVSPYNQLNKILHQIQQAETKSDLVDALHAAQHMGSELIESDMARIKTNIQKYTKSDPISDLWTEPVRQEYGRLLRSRHPINRRDPSTSLSESSKDAIHRVELHRVYQEKQDRLTTERDNLASIPEGMVGDRRQSKQIIAILEREINTLRSEIGHPKASSVLDIIREQQGADETMESLRVYRGLTMSTDFGPFDT